jgi:twinkle protein
MAWENLVSKIRYMVLHLGATHIFLDHLSIIVSGIGEGDERRMIDQAMTKLRSITEELGIALILVSHLKRPEGRGHEEGAQTSLAQLRGSHAIGQLSDIVVGLERNQQDEEEPNVTTLRVLKNRFSGETGCANKVYYSKQTGRLTERCLSTGHQVGSGSVAEIPF